MPYLNTTERALALNKVRHSLHALDLSIIPQTRTVGRDSSMRMDTCRFYEDQRGTLESILTQSGDMIVRELSDLRP